MLSSRFIVQAVGPEGGSRTKSGIRAVQAFLFHEKFHTSLTVAAFLQEGIPHVEISAFRSGQRHTLFKGPLDELVPQAANLVPMPLSTSPTPPQTPDS